jgi:molybdenum cofactor synthesis domain-containing protein
MAADAKALNAAALIVGNELLSGKVQDENLVALAKTLRQLGIALERVVMVPDEVSLIAEEVRALAARYGVVVTSGGVGPTHDDVTIEAVALAFDVPVVTSAVMEALLVAHYGDRCTAGHLRMALIPQGCELVSNAEVTWPTVLMRNVWVLPGIPEVFRMKLALLRERLAGGTPFLSRAVYTQMDEGNLKPLLDAVVAMFPDVEIGSYPKWGDPSYRTKLTFDGRNVEALRIAVEAFVRSLPVGEPQRID